MANQSSTPTMDQQAENNRRYRAEVERDFRLVPKKVVPFPQRAAWELRCPNCAHVVKEQSEGGMDRAFAAHYIERHRPLVNGDAA